MTATLAAASFAALLVLISHPQHGLAADTGIYAFAVALPTLAMYVFAAGDPAQRFHGSCLMRVITVLGLFAAIIGLTSTLATASGYAAAIFCILSNNLSSG